MRVMMRSGPATPGTLPGLGDTWAAAFWVRACLRLCGVFLLSLSCAACTTLSSSVPRSGATPATASGAHLQRAIIDVRTRQFIAFDAMVAELAQAQVVAVGEEHYQPAIQAFELYLFESLLHHRPQRLALAMEFLERDAQEAVDAYLAGSLEQAAFLKRIDASPDFIQLYFPLLQHARQARVPVLALNIPRNLANQVSKVGLQTMLAQLGPAERAYVPTDLVPVTPAYRTYFLEAVAKFHPPANAQQADNFVDASHLKDDTMAATLATFLAQHADFSVLVIAGRFHIDYGTALPTLLRQRRPEVQLRRLTTMTVEAGQTMNLQSMATEMLADYVWFAPVEPTAPRAWHFDILPGAHLATQLAGPEVGQPAW